MPHYKINCEIIVDIIAKNINEAEEILKNKYSTIGVKFYQVIEYKEITGDNHSTKG